MYGWGDDTATWKKPGAYKFDSAKAPYLKKVEAEGEAAGPREYLSKKTPKLELTDPKKVIRSESANPILLVVDGTGSMQKWPKEIFDRIPLFYKTLASYQEDVDVSISVIGDATQGVDRWPVQVTDFAKGVTLDAHVQGLLAEGGGGPGIRENYELWAYNALTRVETPNAKNPFLIIMGDEKFYDAVNPVLAQKFLGLDAKVSVDSLDVWKQLGQRFDTYFLQKPCGSGENPKLTKEVYDQWTKALGQQRVIPIYEEQRMIDVAIGLIAQKWGKIGDFKDNLEARQDSKSVKNVMKSLKAAPAVPVGDGKSILKLTAGGAKSMPLGGAS